MPEPIKQVENCGKKTQSLKQLLTKITDVIALGDRPFSVDEDGGFPPADGALGLQVSSLKPLLILTLFQSLRFVFAFLLKNIVCNCLLVENNPCPASQILLDCHCHVLRVINPPDFSQNLLTYLTETQHLEAFTLSW